MFISPFVCIGIFDLPNGTFGLYRRFTSKRVKCYLFPNNMVETNYSNFEISSSLALSLLKSL